MPGWQEIYKELSGTGLHIISAAQDTGGEKAAGQWYDRAGATFTQIVDRNHRISSLYNLTNVPSAVWIDEKGQIVRLDDGAYSKKYTFGKIEAGSDQYRTAIRDWVKNGSRSEYILGKKTIQRKLKSKTYEEELAEANFQLAVYYHLKKNSNKADHYWQVSQKMNPASWNYHRQDWAFDAKERREKFVKKLRAQGNRPYYDPIQLKQKKVEADQKTVQEQKKQAEGWISLFDGKSMKGWRPFNSKKSSSNSWVIRDGCLMSTKTPGDIITEKQYGDFELKFEWKVTGGANSGVFYKVTENVDRIHKSGLEYQVLDNVGQANRPITEQAAACYGIVGAASDHTKPVGRWNKGRILVRGNQVQHFLNGKQVIQYEIGSEQYKKQVAAGPLRNHSKLAKFSRGHISLQNYHGHQAWFRKLFIRPIPPKGGNKTDQ